jgi:hypothetical protein
MWKRRLNQLTHNTAVGTKNVPKPNDGAVCDQGDDSKRHTKIRELSRVASFSSIHNNKPKLGGDFHCDQ